MNLADRRRGSIGYWLLPEARGKGLARLALLTEPDNVRSRRVAERCGFRLEGVLRSVAEIDGRRVDYCSFSLLPGDLEEERQGFPRES